MLLNFARVLYLPLKFAVLTGVMGDKKKELKSVPEAFMALCLEKLQWSLTLQQEATPPSVSKVELRGGSLGFVTDIPLYCV